MTIEPLGIDMVDWSSLELHVPPIEKPRLRHKPARSLVLRCPNELLTANSLKIERGGDCHAAHNHSKVVVNGIELCPASAIMFLVAAKNYRWSDGLGSAIEKIMEEAYEG